MITGAGVKNTGKADRHADAPMVKIFSEDEVRYLTRRLRRIISSDLPGLSAHSIEDSVRFGPLAIRVRETRENRGIDLKTAAKAIGVPQYRLRYIENSNLKHLRVSDLRTYIDFLGLANWFQQWSKANPKLAARLAKGSGG